MGLSNLHLRRLQSNQGLVVAKTQLLINCRSRLSGMKYHPFIQCLLSCMLMTAAQTEIEHSWCLPLANSLPPLVIACNLLRKSITRSFKRRLYSPMFTLFRLSYTIYIVRCYRIMRCSAECKVISPSHAWNLGLTGPNTLKLYGALPLDLNIDFLNN